MKNAAIASAILHVIILILFSISIGNPFQKTIRDQQPIVVDFVQIAEKSAAPKLSPMNEKMEEPKVESREEKKIEPEAPKPEPEENRIDQPKEEEPEPLKEPEKPKEKPVEKLKEPEPKVEPKEEEVDPILKKEPEKKPEKKPEPKKDKKDQKKKKDKKDLKKKDKKAEINLRKNKSKTDKKADPKSKKSASNALDDLLKEVDKDSEGNNQDGSPAETVGEVITATQIDAIRQKIRKCWLVPAGLKGAKDMVVDIKMEIAPDGTVKTAEVVDKARMVQDNGFRTAAENARRAVLDPECNPLPLPQDKYEQWKDLEMSFNPKDMF